MADRAELEKRVRELEAEVAVLRGRARIQRYRSAFTFAGLPFISVAVGPDPAKGEARGHAKGILALGDIATGVFAMGGVARGLVAFGGVAIGAITFGGLSLGALAAVGGLAIGGIAVGGGALGYGAIGGAALGEFACGGGAFGSYVVSPVRRDPEAVSYFAQYGLDGLCAPPRRANRSG
jgi:hypothetical protein